MVMKSNSSGIKKKDEMGVNVYLTKVGMAMSFIMAYQTEISISVTN